jgi:hypothetical protein
MEAPEALTVLKTLFPSKSNPLIQLILSREAEKAIVDWRAHQLIQFIGLMEFFAEDLQDAYEKKRVMTVSWIARSLLEIFVWVQYCNVSEANAKRFFEDVARDFHGCCKALEKLNVDYQPGIDQSRDLVKRFWESATSEGIKDVADGYKDVREAAAEIGVGSFYAGLNKIYSKLAHPTALALDAAFRKVGRENYRDLFVVDAMQFSIRTLSNIEDFVRDGYGRTPSWT